MLDIEQMKKLIEAAAEAGTSVGAIMADGEVSLMDLRHAPALLRSVKGLVGVDYKALAAEIKDMSDAEKAELQSLFVAKFDLPQDSVEQSVEMGMDMLLTLLQAVAVMVDVASKVKKPEEVPAA